MTQLLSSIIHNDLYNVPVFATRRQAREIITNEGLFARLPLVGRELVISRPCNTMQVFIKSIHIVHVSKDEFHLIVKI